MNQTIPPQFGGPPVPDQDKKQNTGKQPIVEPTLSSSINDISRRLRILEERYVNLRRKTQVTDQNMISSNRQEFDEIRAVNAEISELRREVHEMKDKIQIFIKELQMCANKEDVKIVERFINLWEPINFVTQNEAERIVKNVIDEQLKRK